MKPAAFNYHRPGSVEEALATYATCDDPRFLAGGQSLVPMMALRLAAPTDLIDLNAIEGLAGVTHTATDTRIGAMTRQEELTADRTLCTRVPALEAVIEAVGHPGTRTRGTIGGSVCHADPAAELPALLLAVDAVLSVASAGGTTRQVEMGDFFGGYFENTLASDEILTEIRIPHTRRRMGFREVALRSADFALAGAIADAHLGDDGSVEAIRLVAFALGDRPQRLPEIEAAVLAEGIGDGSPERIMAAAELAADLLSPPDEPHLSAAYRRRVGVSVVRSAIEGALGIDRAGVAA